MYEGPIRDGAYGSVTTKHYRVWRAPKLGTAFLDPMPTTDYVSDGYRNSVNGDGSVERYFELHDQLALQHFALLKDHLRRGMTVADLGCGGGAVLDLAGGFAPQRLAIEPYSGYHESLGRRGHLPFSSVADTLQKFDGVVELAWSFHVIEHVADPVLFLSDIGKLLAIGGKAFVMTPNIDDFLMKGLFGDYAPFWFRTAHLWYFSGAGLAEAARQAGLEVRAIAYHQEFPLSNVMHWMRDRHPRGDARMAGVTEIMDKSWRMSTEQSGTSSAVGILVEKRK